jgi:hypothetical protein
MKPTTRILLAIHWLIIIAMSSSTALAQAKTPPSAPIPAATPQANDLTGVWKSNGATFYVRQLGNEIWWRGDHSPTNPRWTNVAKGTVDGNLLHIKWVDVPLGETRGEGTLTLRIVDSKLLKIEENPNDFWAHDWIRQ